MLKVGLIGCGFMGGMHSDCYKEIDGVEIVAVADVSDLEGMQIYMQNIKAARLDGENVEATIKGNVIEFSGKYGNSNKPSSGGGGGGGGSSVKPPVADDKEDVNAEDDIVAGDESGNFNPNDNVTREQFLKMLVEAADIEAVEGENTFEDVKSDAWYKPYVLKAKNFGIANGISDVEFGIGSNITRQDMAVMISRTINKLGLEIDKKDVLAFADDSAVADYAKESVLFMKSIGLIEGYDKEFRPKDNLTRAEAAKVISELLKILK